MIIRHAELREANEFISRLHRHHKPTVGHRFSLKALSDTGQIIGVCVVGRPVSRSVNYMEVLEVTRLCTDGTKNACSALYAAAARAGKALGYTKIQTYILDSETGVSLKASGWALEDAKCGGGKWKRSDGAPRRDDQPICHKQRWAKCLV